jgi:hypothetical protein
MLQWVPEAAPPVQPIMFTPNAIQEHVSRMKQPAILLADQTQRVIPAQAGIQKVPKYPRVPACPSGPQKQTQNSLDSCFRRNDT